MIGRNELDEMDWTKRRWTKTVRTHHGYSHPADWHFTVLQPFEHHISIVPRGLKGPSICPHYTEGLKEPSIFTPHYAKKREPLGQPR